jgi:hypothetical protein
MQAADADSTTEQPAPAPTHRVVNQPTVLLAPILAVVTLLALSVPGWVPVAAQLCAVAWIGLIAVWAVEVVLKIVHRRAGRADPRPFWSLLVLPGFLALVLFSAAADLPIRARFNLSRSEMTDAANDILQARDEESPSRVGSIPFQSIESNGVVVWFVTAGFGTTSHWGFVYAPSGPAGLAGESATVDLGGGWYSFYEGPGTRFVPG